MTRQAYVHHPSKTLVYWTYKAANTSVVHGLAFDAMGVPQDGRDPRLELDPYLVGYDHGRILAQEQGYRSIALIREPYDRLVSAFLHIFVAREDIGIDHIEQLERSGNIGYSALSDGATAFRGVVFRDFIGYCIASINERQGEPDLDGHWNTQIPFDYLDRQFRYDYLFSMQHVTEFFAQLSALVGTKVAERRVNWHHKSERVADNLVDVCSLEYCHDGSLRHIENFEDEGLRAAVETAYTPDVAYYRMAN